METEFAYRKSRYAPFLSPYFFLFFETIHQKNEENPLYITWFFNEHINESMTRTRGSDMPIEITNDV